MQFEISRTYLFQETARDIWKLVQETYSKAGNATRVFKLMVRIQATKQGTQSMAVCYNNLQLMWQDLDHSQHLELTCPACTALITKMLERD